MLRGPAQPSPEGCKTQSKLHLCCHGAEADPRSALNTTVHSTGLRYGCSRCSLSLRILRLQPSPRKHPEYLCSFQQVVFRGTFKLQALQIIQTVPLKKKKNNNNPIWTGKSMQKIMSMIHLNMIINGFASKTAGKSKMLPLGPSGCFVLCHHASCEKAQSTPESL